MVFLFKKRFIFLLNLLTFLGCLLLVTIPLKAQTSKTIKAGSFIIDMGVLPQTVNNALRPYGMIYDLMKNYQVPILWSISSTKAKDGIDFSIGAKNYSGGPFIIEADFITTDVSARITYWQTQGIIGVTTTSPVTVPVGTTIYKAPNWTLDKQNGIIAIPYFTNAAIPSAAYGGSTSANWKNPSDLTACDDLFIMPHADPAWITHSNLYTWNRNFKGGIWLGCSAGSHLNDMFDNVTPVDFTMQSNVLAGKTSNASGSGPHSENSLILAANHTDGKAPYTYDPSLQSDPIMQFLGTIDAAVSSGAETVYIPLAPGWLSTTSIGVYDPIHKQKIDGATNHRAAIVAWGPSFGLSTSGRVLMQAAHSFSGTNPANIAAQRIFFNFSFTAGKGVIGKDIVPVISGLPSGTILYSGQSLNLTLTNSENINLIDLGYTFAWTSSAGGTFSPSTTSQNVSFTAPSNLGIAQLKVTIADACGLTTFDSKPVVIQCLMNVNPVPKDICNGTAATSGQITVNITSGSGPFVWNFLQTSGGSASGTGTSAGTVSGTTISFPITGLTAGTYSVTVKGSNGTGCTSTFKSTIVTLPAFSVASSSTNNISANGGTDGSATVTVTGGTPAYTYLWNNGTTEQSLSNVAAGSYTLTVTDSKTCVANLPAAITLTEPATITINSAVTNVTCYGLSNGTITATVSGGASPYTYLWNDGITTLNRTSLSSGTYTITVTDANSVKKSFAITITQPTAVITSSTTSTNLLCSNSSPNGVINLTPTGGTPSYSYAWSKSGSGSYSATSQNISGLDIGTYNVIITDANGCRANQTANITKPTAISISGTSVDPTCPLDATSTNNDGSINITPSGGVGPFTYLWNNGSTSQNRTALNAATYSATITDANGCTATYSKTLVAQKTNSVAPSSIKH